MVTVRCLAAIFAVLSLPAAAEARNTAAAPAPPPPTEDVGPVVVAPARDHAIETLDAAPGETRAIATPGSAPEAAAPAAGSTERQSRSKLQSKTRSIKAAPTAARVIATPPVFRVASGDAEIYIAGTFHALPTDVDWRSNALAHAIDKAETLVFEAEVDTPVAQMRAQNMLRTQGRLPAGSRLSTILGPEDAKRLAAAATSLDVDPAAFEPMRPWQAFLLLSVRQLMKDGYDPQSGVEQKMLAEARLRGRTLRFFESVDEQLGFFTGMSRAEERRMLSITLRDWSKQSDDIRTMLEAWKKGDLDTIDVLMNAPMRAEAPDVYQRLIAGRNAVWADKVGQMLEGRGVVLVAVGAGHLAGPDSLPALLAARGLTVERVGEKDVAER